MTGFRCVKKAVPEKYEKLVPDRIRYDIRTESLKVIEASEDKDSVKGVLIYSFEDDNAELLWIYVLPAERGQGIGSGLMEKFFNSIEGFKEIRADLIVTDDSIKLQSFLTAYRFRFQKEISYEFVRRLSVLKKEPKLMIQEPAPGCISLKDTDRAAFNRILTEMGLEAEVYDTEKLDMELSCIHRNKMGEINGILLINRYGDSLLEPILLHVTNENSKIQLKMLQMCIYLADRYDKEDITVYIRCRDSKTGLLIDSVLKDVHPMRMIRGICRS
ncbi:MAG: GNAT family N-acetyltransferase [Lachnospiraceae bacterium]|nr:GNAT family N-acetyltransferase [Lachnospiraceae bacterium]